MFDKIRQIYYRKQVEKALLSRDISQRNGVITTVAFLYNGVKTTTVSEMKNMATSLSISEENICFLSFVTLDKETPSLSSNQFSKEDFSWRGEIKRKDVVDFVETSFDVLICYQKGVDPIIDIIASNSKAKFKIGLRGSNENIYDLIINASAEKGKIIAKEIKKYLTILGKLEVS